jgi:hypothetical protein
VKSAAMNVDGFDWMQSSWHAKRSFSQILTYQKALPQPGAIFAICQPDWKHMFTVIPVYCDQSSYLPVLKVLRSTQRLSTSYSIGLINRVQD